MGHPSIRPAENVIEDYRDKNKLYHAVSANYYTMVQSDGKFYQRRHQIGFNGSVANVAEEQVDYVIDLAIRPVVTFIAPPKEN
jgi:hypothetical protein